MIENVGRTRRTTFFCGRVGRLGAMLQSNRREGSIEGRKWDDARLTEMESQGLRTFRCDGRMDNHKTAM